MLGVFANSQNFKLGNIAQPQKVFPLKYLGYMEKYVTVPYD